MANIVKIDWANLKPLPIGDSDWAEFSQSSYTVDKTLLIKDILDDNTKVALFTRPRRFGKTTALRMIRAFFERTAKDTSFLFADKKIWAVGERYRAEQGKYPVIYLTFKDVDGLTFESAFYEIKMLVGTMISEHREAISSLEAMDEQEAVKRAMDGKGTVADVAASLGLLAKAIHLHELRNDPEHGVKPIILIDEYDGPVNRASTRGYLDEMTVFMRKFLSGAMKDNDHVKMGIMTGVLRVAKEGILSGLNNLRVWTVFDRKFNGHFGFTEEEVSEMASFYGVPERMAEIKSWYDGYNFAGVEIYNPWSVLNYFDNDCEPKTYWLDTSSNDIINEIVRDLPHDTAQTLERLLGENAEATVRMASELGPYARIRSKKDTLYALLVSAGYLKCCSAIEHGSCRVAIPNREISHVFVDDIVSEFSNVMSSGPDDIVRAIFDRDPVAFREAIQLFLTESVSYFDGAAEGFYHGLVLGFLAILRNRYRVLSNREVGFGRFDIALYPLVEKFPGVIIEVKATKLGADDLAALAKEARAQIDQRSYAADMAAQGIADILKLGLAFHGKNVEIVTE